MWLADASIFIGDFNLNNLHKGKLYKLQPDNTYHLYSVTFDSKADHEKDVYPDS